MSSSRRIVPIYYNVPNATRVDVNNQIPKEKPILQRMDQVLFRFTLYDGDIGSTPSAYELCGGETFSLGIDSTFRVGHADLVTSNNDQFNKTEDWTEISLEGGKITARADLSTNELRDDFDTDPGVTDLARKDMYVCVFAQVGGEKPYPLMHFDVNMKNVACEFGTNAPAPTTQYATLAALAGLVEHHTSSSGKKGIRFKNADGTVVGGFYEP